jgi:hypothetical protein
VQLSQTANIFFAALIYMQICVSIFGRQTDLLEREMKCLLGPFMRFIEPNANLNTLLITQPDKKRT